MLAVVQMLPVMGRILRKKLFSQRGSLDEGNRLNDILKYEEDILYSREVVTVKSGEVLPIGQVVGKIKLGTAPTTGTAGSNTGGGTVTGVTAGAKAKVGVYTLVNKHAVAGQGLFSVEDPDGEALPDAVVGVAYVDDQINFTLNDGSPDFALSDNFTITIAAGAASVVGIDPTAVDGSQDAYGILIAACDATAGDTKAVAIVRHAQVVEANLVWLGSSPEMSAAQIAAGMAQLKAVGIISVEEI
jgi:hypothetical protein